MIFALNKIDLPEWTSTRWVETPWTAGVVQHQTATRPPNKMRSKTNEPTTPKSTDYNQKSMTNNLNQIIPYSFIIIIIIFFWWFPHWATVGEPNCLQKTTSKHRQLPLGADQSGAPTTMWGTSWGAMVVSPRVLVSLVTARSLFVMFCINVMM